MYLFCEFAQILLNKRRVKMTHGGICLGATNVKTSKQSISRYLIPTCYLCTSLYPITISSNLSSNTFPFPLLRPWPAQAVTSSRCFIEGCKFLSPTDTSLQIAPHGSILTTNCHTQTVSSEPLIIPRSIFNWILVEE